MKKSLKKDIKKAEDTKASEDKSDVIAPEMVSGTEKETESPDDDDHHKEETEKPLEPEVEKTPEPLNFKEIELSTSHDDMVSSLGSCFANEILEQNNKQQNNKEQDNKESELPKGGMIVSDETSKLMNENEEIQMLYELLQDAQTSNAEKAANEDSEDSEE